MKMKWQFATIFATMYAVSLPVAAVEDVKNTLTPQQASKLLSGDTPPNMKPVSTVVPPQSTDSDRLARLGGNPLALLKITPNVQHDPSSRKARDNIVPVKTSDKPPKPGKPAKRQKPSKRSQAKSR